MRVFVDACVTYDLMPHLVGHDFTHATDTPYARMRDHILLPTIAPLYDAFLTTDKGIPYQNNLKKLSLVFVILRPRSNDLKDVLPLVAETLRTLDLTLAGGASHGDYFEIFP